MKKVRFIANPFSGVNRKRNLAKLLKEHLDPEIYHHELVYTEYAGHAIELSKEAVRQGYDMVVACGGDGSINEISGPLIGTGTVLGILPCGSGNGFATHLGIGRNVVKAIQYLNDGQPITIDTCRMNGRSYVNLAGVGFDAAVANRLHGSKLRGLWAYFRFTVEELFKYKMLPLEITVDGKTCQLSCLLAEVANAPIYGYGFSIVPPAKFNDGKLEVLLVNAAPKWRYLFSLWRLLNGTFHKSSLTESFTAREVFIRPARKCAAHVDGEGFELEGGARFSILPASLKVLCPKEYVGILK
ncbi:MAG TPA: diacylglycerol kinase family lipid kinase [Bacteroidetes bacterium]|nr:diacylglycerol kinase family lipid kinase [Bacteroidota bacterium]